MLDLMPKVSEIFDQIGGMEKIIEKYKKVEIQFFQQENFILDFEFEQVIEKYLQMFDLQEITIHPPLNYFDIEAVYMYDPLIIEKQLNTCLKLSEKHNVKINLLYHTHLAYNVSQFVLVSYIEKLLKIIEGKNVNLILENLYLIPEKRTEFSALSLVRSMNHPNLKVCFDICHAYCQANMFEIPIEEFLDRKFENSECDKYISQIHFSYTGNHDGYKDKKTHGIGHPNKELLLADCKLLEKFNLLNKTIVTEIAENDYSHRSAQIQDINWLEELMD